MNKRKACGFDLNGWRDFAVKNWRSVPGKQEEIGPIDIIEGGPLTSVVNVGNENSRWVGGPQADLAPHGMGDGWGEVGLRSRRVLVRDLLEGREEREEPFAAAFMGLARGANYNVVSIDDSSESTEIDQERLLKALSVGRFPNSMLVWRPVLAALHAYDKGHVFDGMWVAVICHSNRGVSVQKLLMRRASGRSNEVIAPERRRSGKTVPGNIGYERLVEAARNAALEEKGWSGRTAHRAQARSVGKAALGMTCAREMVRLQNGNWEEMPDLSGARCVNLPILSEALPDIGNCSAVLMETLSEGVVREALSDFIRRAVSCEVIRLEPTAVAEGALVAARRLRDGDPVYFDFLPRISTIVFGPDGASSFDLIDAKETLEAGRIYRSPKPAELAIPSGQPSISVYLRKDAEPHPRKATIHLEKPLQQQSPVSLWVEQKPAAGRARIVMDAPGLGRQFTIDWSEATDDDRSWNAIIESHEAEVSIPRRLVLECSLRSWEESRRSVSLFELLQTDPERCRVDWAALAGKLSARPFGEYCISSDGHLPDKIDGESKLRFEQFTKIALDVTHRRLDVHARPEVEDNGALKFLTWQFRRCPPEVAEWLMDCIERRRLTGFSHPFVRYPSSWVLIYQGLGRILNNERSEQRVIRLLMSSRVEAWNWRVECACMAFLLSRSDTAPKLLTREDVDRLAKRTITDFENSIGTGYTKFIYAQFLMAGLLRWRLKEPKALLLGADPLAENLLDVLKRVKDDLSLRPQSSEHFTNRREKFLPFLDNLKRELRGEGSNPDLLLDIYNAI